MNFTTKSSKQKFDEKWQSILKSLENIKAMLKQLIAHQESQTRDSTSTAQIEVWEGNYSFDTMGQA